jgi:ribosomal protein L33
MNAYKLEGGNCNVQIQVNKISNVQIPKRMDTWKCTRIQKHTIHMLAQFLQCNHSSHLHNIIESLINSQGIKQKPSLEMKAFLVINICWIQIYQQYNSYCWSDVRTTTFVSFAQLFFTSPHASTTKHWNYWMKQNPKSELDKWSLQAYSFNSSPPLIHAQPKISQTWNIGSCQHWNQT